MKEHVYRVDDKRKNQQFGHEINNNDNNAENNAEKNNGNKNDRYSTRLSPDKKSSPSKSPQKHVKPRLTALQERALSNLTPGERYANIIYGDLINDMKSMGWEWVLQAA
jgi:hypothetical protein